MDIALVAIYTKRNIIQYAGANNSLYIIRGGQSAVNSQQSAVGSQQSAVGSEAVVRGAKRGSYGQQTSIFEPNIYLYDKYPGGVGLSEPLFRMSETLLENTYKLISNCSCLSGCPSCVGPVGEVGEKGKEVALAILKKLSVVSS